MWVLVTFLALLRLQYVMSTSNQTFLFGSSYLGDKYNHNLPNFLSTLTSQASKTNFYNSSFGQTPNQIFGLYLCRGDIDHQACSDCVNYAAKALLKNCLNSTEALYWYDHCMVRYSNEPFFGKFKDGSWGATWSVRNLTTNRIRFAEIVRDTISSLAVQAANDKCGEKFAKNRVRINRFEWLYAMAQCSWDLTASDCYKCLSMAIGHLLRGYRHSAAAHYDSCRISYETSIPQQSAVSDTFGKPVTL